MSCGKSDGCIARGRKAERAKIVELIKNCAETYDPATDADVKSYLKNLANRIESEEF